MDRNASLLVGLSPADPLIELGPSFSPIAPRSAGWNATVVDHDTRAALVEKYKTATVDTSRIEDVDIIWRGGALDALFPPSDHGRYRALIASHVIEHLPDPLGFFASCARLLHPQNGLILLAVPDKRWCFDVFKPLTTSGQWFAAREAGSARHSRRTAFDDLAYAASLDGRIGWGRERMDGLRLFHPLEVALRAWEQHDDAPDAPYQDAHAWQFTPASFQLLILDAAAAGLCDWRVEWVEPQPAVEFLVRLRRGAARFASPEARDAQRLSLLRQSLLELHEQTGWLASEMPPGPEAPPPPPPPPGDDLTRAQINEIALTAAMVRKALRPVRAVWRRLRPVRDRVARWRAR